MEAFNIQQEITKLIAEDRLEKALRAFLERTDSEALLNLHNRGVALYAQFNQQKKDGHLGLLDYQDLVKTKTRINLALLDLLQQLPNEEETPKKKKKRSPGIHESKLKRQVRRIMISSKVLTLLFLFFLWDVGGFTNDQAIGTATLLVPLFTAYTVLMVRDATRDRFVRLQPAFTEMLLTHRFKRSTYLWLLSYTASHLVGAFPEIQRGTGLWANEWGIDPGGDWDRGVCGRGGFCFV